MKTAQLKINIDNAVSSIIDNVFPQTTLTNRFIGATARTIYNQKRHVLFDMIDALADKNGEVDVEYMVDQYEQALMPNGTLEINLKELSQNIGLNLPDYIVGKTIKLDKNDIKRIFGL